MRITKDEARILAIIVSDGKYEINNLFPADIQNQTIQAFISLEERLRKYGKDNRRNGRKSMDYLDDCLKRFLSKNSSL